MADPVKPPPADDAGRQAWIAEQNKLNAERRAAEYQQRLASKPDAAPAEAAPKKQGSWLDRADDLKDKVKKRLYRSRGGRQIRYQGTFARTRERADDGGRLPAAKSGRARSIKYRRP